MKLPALGVDTEKEPLLPLTFKVEPFASFAVADNVAPVALAVIFAVASVLELLNL